MTDALLFLHGLLPEYPDPYHWHPPLEQVSKHWTDKQRRWFFANLRAGKLQLPYKRTGQLGRSFTTETTVQDTAVLGEIGTSLSYAPWVVGADYPGEPIRGRSMYQARVHQGRWWQFGDVVDDNREAALDEFDAAFGRELSARVRAQA